MVAAFFILHCDWSRDGRSIDAKERGRERERRQKETEKDSKRKEKVREREREQSDAVHNRTIII